VKILFLALIALVIPAFFALVFVLSTHARLTTLRQRCREARARAKAAAMRDARRDYEAAVGKYESARTSFPASLIARALGFHSAELQATQDSTEPPEPTVG
jgi:hypothetical protein